MSHYDLSARTAIDYRGGCPQVPVLKVVHKEDNKQSYDYATNEGRVIAR